MIVHVCAAITSDADIATHEHGYFVLYIYTIIMCAHHMYITLCHNYDLPLHPVCEVSASVYLDYKEVDQTKWAYGNSRAWDKDLKIDLHQNREIEIIVHCRDGDLTVLSGVLYLRLEDFFDTNGTTYCLPLEPQGILLVEVAYEIPRTERRQPKLKRGKRIFQSKCDLYTCCMHTVRLLSDVTLYM